MMFKELVAAAEQAKKDERERIVGLIQARIDLFNQQVADCEDDDLRDSYLETIELLRSLLKQI